MKLSDQSYTHLQIPSVQPDTPGVKAPIVADKQQEVASGSKVERDLGNESGRSSQYPMASEEEMRTRDKRGIFKFFKPKPKPKPKPTPTPTPTPEPEPELRVLSGPVVV